MQTSYILERAHSFLENRNSENSFIEYAKSINSSDSLLKTVCAFANNIMNNTFGYLLIGVDKIDDSENGIFGIPERPICGIPKEDIESITNELDSLFSNITPKVNYQILTDMIDDKYYLIVAVQQGFDGPYAISHSAEVNIRKSLPSGRYVRIERENKLVTRLEEMQLLQNFIHYDYLDSVNEMATISDLNFDIVREYLRELGTSEVVLKEDNLQLAKRLNLVVDYGTNIYRAKNIAVLMFCYKPDFFIKNAYVRLLEDPKGIGYMKTQEFHGPLWKIRDQILVYFDKNIKKQIVVNYPNSPQNKSIYNYPYETFEELVTNAIVHNDYKKHSCIEIYLRPDHISIINHNKPNFPVTIDKMNNSLDFFNRRNINPELVTMFSNLHLTDSYGSGIMIAKDAMEKNGSPAIKFDSISENDDYTLVNIPINVDYYNEVVSKSSDKDKLNSEQEDILKIIAEKQSVTIPELIENGNSLSYEDIKYNLNVLKYYGFVERVGCKRTGYWKIV